jgi:hypothetical protein
MRAGLFYVESRPATFDRNYFLFVSFAPYRYWPGLVFFQIMLKSVPDAVRGRRAFALYQGWILQQRTMRRDED